MKTTITIALAVIGAAVALIVPATASAWVPGSEQCTDYKAQHGYDHPDCVPPPPELVTVCVNGVTQQVPKDQVPPEATQGECVPPPETEQVCRGGQVIEIPKGTQQPGDTAAPCVVPPPVTQPPPTEGYVAPPVTLPEEQPVAPKEQGQHHVGKPGSVVAGKEQVNGGGTPEQPVEAAPGETLPFTGGDVFGPAALGLLGLSLGGVLFWRTRLSQ